MDEIESKTCIRFKERTVEVGYINIFSGQGCYSTVGKRLVVVENRLVEAPQDLSLERSGCVTNRVVVHEIMHALGLFHMQSGFDRDNYVRVNYENIVKGMEHNFRKYENHQVSYYGTSYDYDSLMHYGSNYFSSNGKPTIETLDPAAMQRIARGTHMSDGDVQRVNNMYCT